MRKSSSKLQTRQSLNRCMLCVAGIAIVVLTSVTLWLCKRYGLFDVSCGSYGGVVCNGGECVNGVCVCKHAFFSGPVCATTLAEGVSNTPEGRLGCHGHGYVGATHATRDDIPRECRETVPSALNGYTKRGGWDTLECLQAVQSIMRRVELGTISNITELFAVPLCQCHDQWSGPGCSEVAPCPLGVTLERCSGNGNRSVGYMDNLTSNGIGCQCKNVNYHLTTARYQTYTNAGIERLRKEFALVLNRPMCGTFYQHPTKLDLKLVWNQDYLNSFGCFCNEKHTGEACQYNHCPEDKFGNACSGHGHPGFGAGAAVNISTKLSSKSQTVCAPSYVNCATATAPGGEDRCVPHVRLCSVSSHCPFNKPVRCRDGSCVKFPVDLRPATYSYGLYENFTRLLDKKACYATSFLDNSTYLTPEDYLLLLHECAGDEATVVEGNLLLPAGDLYMDSSLLVVALESPYADGELTLTYRGQERTLQGSGTLLAIFNETYEQEQQRLFSPSQDDITVELVSDNEVDLFPSPFLYDAENFIPKEWQQIRLVSPDDTVVVLSTSRVRTEYRDDGDWFIANLTATTVLIPSGAVVSIDRCFANFRQCVWNYATKLNYDGTRKLCSARSVSTNLNCVVSPYSYPRIYSILTATAAGLAQYDWGNLGPWRVGTSSFAIDDFSTDGDWLTFTPSPTFRGVTGLSFIELEDVAIPGACPPSFTPNASTLNTKWFNEGTRSVALLHPGQRVVAQLLVFGQPRIVRATVAAPATGPTVVVAIKGYGDIASVTHPKLIAEDEFNQGLPEESFRVFPGICSDGQPSALRALSFDNVTVTCDCDLAQGRVATCRCLDEHVVEPYACTCRGGVCDCVGFGMTDLEQALAAHLLEDLQAVCFYSHVRAPAAEEDSTVGAVYNSGGATSVHFSRPAWSAYLAEIRLYPGCIEPEIIARTSLFSDSNDTLPLESSCIGQNQTIRPLYPDGFEDVFDEWYISNLTASQDVEIIPVFAPNGIPARIESVSVTSNAAQKNAVLWNDMTYWLSDEEDIKPTVTLTFTRKQHVTAAYVVLYSAGTLLADTGDVIPALLYVQATEDGLNWVTVGRITSDVYEGKEDRWVAIDYPNTLWLGIRLRGLHIRLGVREFIPLTNQRCDHPNMELIATPDFESITSTVIERILAAEITTENCFAYDNCVIQRISGGPATLVSSTSECADEKWSIDGLGLPASVWDAAEIFYTDAIFQENLRAVNATQDLVGTYDSRYLHVWWYGNGTAAPSLDLFANLSAVAAPVGQVRNLTDAYYYVVLDETQEWVRLEEDEALFPRYQTYRNLSLVERGIACTTGTHLSKCGNSERTTAKNPGVGCTLSDFERTILADYRNRTDHVVKNSAPLDEYLQTGKVTIRLTNITLSRRVAKIAPSPCLEGCGGLLRCPTGECVQTLASCPQPRYNNPGDGCIRRSTDDNKYLCVCDRGFGGRDCSLRYCVPGDPYRGAIDPHLVCACGPHPPLKTIDPQQQAPPGGSYSTAQLLVLNRGGKPRAGPGDVGWKRVSTEFAPMGNAIWRHYDEGGRTVRTTCGFYVIGPFGQILSLEDCVAARDPITGFVTDWKWWDAPNGTQVQYTWWGNEARYDQVRFRCFIGGSWECVPSEKDCFNVGILRPACGSTSSKCRVDGTCECADGRKTFKYTQEYTDKALEPYLMENPTIFASGRPVPANVEHCNARDCSNGQCGIPMGCFPGTPERDFADRHVACPDSSGHGGKCGVDYKACDRGEVTDMLPCCGKGLPRQRDYRPEEMYCACGDLQTRLVSLKDGGDVTHRRETTELVKNGWSGEVCQNYWCGDDPRKLHYSRRDPVTLQPYRDREYHILPGKWIGGACGAHIGPSPDHKHLWQTKDCCAEYSSRLDRCPKVLCRIGGVPTCVLPEACTGSERTPMVYACNGKGRARADSTCLCETDPDTGIGWAADHTGEGCYEKVACAVASNGRPCNAQETSAKTMRVITKEAFLESQIYSFFLRAGMPISAEEIVKYLVSSVSAMTKLLEGALVQVALRVIDALAGVAAGVCVYPTDNSSHPFGMLPYEGREDQIGPYLKSFKMPFDISSYVTSMVPNYTILTDRIYQQREDQFHVQPLVDQQYKNFPTGSSIKFTFSKLFHITHIKLYGKAQVSGTTISLRFTGDAGALVCGDLVIVRADAEYWSWLSGDGFGIITCQVEYVAYDFETLHNDGWSVSCKGNANSVGCLAFKDAICETLPGSVIQETTSLENFYGCSLEARCCVPRNGLTSEFPMTRSVNITVTGAATVQLQEIGFLGYGETYEPLGADLLREIQWRQGGLVNPHHGGQAIDYLYLRMLLGSQDGEYYVYRSFPSNAQTQPTEVTKMNYAKATEACKSAGGVLATSRGAENPFNFAAFYGEKCFANNPVEGKMCLIGARNRDEVPNPVLQDFFDATCSTFGCFICANGGTPLGGGGDCNFLSGGRIDYVSTPDNGAKWTTNWTGRSSVVGWLNVLKKWFTEMKRQYAMLPMRLDQQFYYIGTVLYGAPMYYLYPVFLSNGQPHYVIHRYLNPSSFPEVSWSELQPRVNAATGRQETVNVATTLNQKGGVVQYWTNPQTCRISLYSVFNCGNPQEYPFYPTFTGAKKEYFVTPADDYKHLFRNLKDGIWDSCADNRTTACTCFGQPIGSGNCPIMGMSIVGSCYVVFEKETFLSDRGQATVYHFTDPQLDNVFRWINPDPLVGNLYPLPGGGSYIQKEPWVFACIREVFANTWKKLGPGGATLIKTSTEFIDATAAKDNPDAWGAGPYYAYEINDRSKLVNLTIFPLFSSKLVETNVRVEPDQQFSNYDDFSMGFRDQPYLCSRVDVRVLKGFTDVRLPNPLPEIPTYAGPLRQAPFWDFIRAIYAKNWDTVPSTTNLIRSEPVVFDNAGGYLFTEAEIVAMMADPGKRNAKFMPCADLGRTVHPCPACVVTQPIGKFEFDPRKYLSDSPNTWVVQVTKMRQENYSLATPPVRPEPHFSWSETATGVAHPFHRSSLMRYSHARAYAHLVVNVTINDYRKRFWLDQCTAVQKNPSTAAVPFSIESIVCENPAPNYFALCQSDWLRHAVQTGRQCDVSGPSGRLSGQPSDSAFPTVFELYPLAVKENYPFEHAVKDAYLAGRLNEFIEEGYIDWESVLSYLQNDVEESLVAGAPGFWDAFVQGLSDRPGFLSDGVTVPNYNAWISVDIFKIWPVDCSIRCSKFTGICRRRRALELKYCDPDAPQITGQELPLDQYPLDMLPVLAPDTYRYPRCSRPIDPGTYWIFDQYGGSSTATKNFIVLEHHPGDNVLVRLARTGWSSWQNTGKSSHGYIFRNTSVLWGEFECSSPSCVISLWVSSISPTYTATPADKLHIGNFTTSPYLVYLNDSILDDQYYKVLGFDIYGARGDTVRLYRALASDPSTVAVCQQPNKRKMYLPSTSIDVDDQRNYCPFVSDESKGIEAGKCVCGDPSSSGPTCERPAIITSWKSQKLTCGGGGQKGGYAIDYWGDRVKVNEDGSWQALRHPEVWGCALINPGLIFRTRLFPETRYDWRMAYFTERQVGQQDFEVKDTIVDDDTGAPLDLTGANARRTCAANSATMPSWFSGDEAANFIRVAAGASTFVDLERTEEGDFRWGSRQTLVAQCPAGDCGEVMSSNPCLDTTSAPTTIAPSSLAPTTTKSPTTTRTPTTLAPTTLAPTTLAPTGTKAPTTLTPTTFTPSGAPITSGPTQSPTLSPTGPRVPSLACLCTQYANLLFSPTTGSNLVDGTTERAFTVSSTGPFTLDLNRPNNDEDGLWVKIWAPSGLTITVSVVVTDGPPEPCTSLGSYEFHCAGDETVETLSFTVTPAPAAVREIGAWSWKNRGTAWTAWYT